MILPKFRIDFDPDWRGNDDEGRLYGAMGITINLPPVKRGGPMEEARHACSFRTDRPNSKDFADAMGGLLSWAVDRLRKKPG